MPAKDTLKTYRQKRDFQRTKEPEGGQRGASDEPIFVIQKHAASNLHYDFRLEVDGLLRSWAVPKGPSADPDQKRLAMPTEDHPLEYDDFEGLIPDGAYGAGPVMVWDTGTHRNLRAEKEEGGLSMPAAYDEGKIEVWLNGQKIKGGYALIRTGRGEDERWPLIKMDDDEADARRNATSTEPKSVLSGRTLKEIATEEGEDEE